MTHSQNNNLNILFTCAGRRNYLIRYFKEALNGNGKVIAADMQLNAPAIVEADYGVLVPNIYDAHYIPELLKIADEYRVDAIISLNDLELPILSKNINQFINKGIKVIVSSPEVIDIAFDKYRTYNYIKSLGLNAPKTYLNLVTAEKALETNEISFPVVLKPRWGSASLGIEFPENPEELKLAYELVKLKLKRSILKNVSEKDLDHAILIQEKINGKEYGMDVLNNFDGSYIGTFAREKLCMRSGETDKAISVIDSNLEGIGSVLGSNLKHVGSMDCDILFDSDKHYVLELNPRFGGGYPFSHEAGVNTASIYVSWLNGNSNIKQFINYKEGLCFSKYDKLMPIN